MILAVESSESGQWPAAKFNPLIVKNNYLTKIAEPRSRLTPNPAHDQDPVGPF